jgi:hypothetical protein
MEPWQGAVPGRVAGIWVGRVRGGMAHAAWEAAIRGSFPGEEEVFDG